MPTFNSNNIQKIVTQALREDLGQGDVTTDLLVSSSHQSKARIFVKEKAVLCGVDFVKAVFKKLDKNLKVNTKFKDGARLKAQATIFTLEGPTRAILKGERVALNFLSYLSGIATQTHVFVERVKKYSVKILDTRKTTPGLRSLERYAVLSGGGTNHRFDLNEMLMIKDNHRVACRDLETLTQTIQRVRAKTAKPVIVEVDTLAQFHQALKAKPNVILLDNMKLKDIKTAANCVQSNHLSVKLEVSGGVNLSNVARFAKTGVDRISVGQLTHTRKAVDFSLELEK